MGSGPRGFLAKDRLRIGSEHGQRPEVLRALRARKVVLFKAIPVVAGQQAQKIALRGARSDCRFMIHQQSLITSEMEVSPVSTFTIQFTNRFVYMDFEPQLRAVQQNAQVVLADGKAPAQVCLVALPE